MSTTLILILVVAGAYVAAHVTFEWLARRYSIVSGAEYLLLGVLLGPEVSGLISASVVGGFGPFMTLALGWVGALVGAQFHVPSLMAIPPVHFRVAFIEGLFTFAVVSAAMLGALMGLLGADVAEALVPAVAMGAVATASAPSGIAMIRRRISRVQPLIRQLEVTTAIDALVGVTAVGLLLSVVHPEPAVQPRAPTATEWAVISVALGVVGGTLFHLFLGDERKIDRLFIGLAGAIILTSGAAAYLRLSPLFTSMLVGFMLVNTSTNREEIKEALVRVERPLYFVLLIFAGAAWELDRAAVLLPVLLFLLTRGGAKVTGAWLAGRVSGILPLFGPGWGRALLGQGGLAVAIGLSYHLAGDLPRSEVVFTAALLSMLLTDLSAARLAQAVTASVLRRREAPEVPADTTGPAGRSGPGGPGEEV